MLQTIDSPVTTVMLTPKPASQSDSLYQASRSILNRLAAVPEFAPYLEAEDCGAVEKLWNICRRGDSLCMVINTYLRNTSRLGSEAAKTYIEYGKDTKPKVYVYHFIVACKNQLEFKPDKLFTLGDLFQDDTNGFVKVIDTLNLVLDKLEEEKIITVQSSDRKSDMIPPKDKRGKIVFELLETERNYVKDLEKLQNYKREAHEQKVLSPDTLHNIFGNLDSLVDFQRRFLIQAEETADKAPEEQRFGLLFIEHEAAFAVYEPFCANFNDAQALVVQESEKLTHLKDYIRPNHDLLSVLIKPVQRVCKYPLLMKQLVEYTPEEWSHVKEIQQGLEAINRVVSRINETQRQKENVLVVEDLKRRVVYRKSRDDQPESKLSVDDFGPLLLHSEFVVSQKNPEYLKDDRRKTQKDAEYMNDEERKGQKEVEHKKEDEPKTHVYLFEKLLFLCKEKKDMNKKNKTLLMKKNKKNDQKDKERVLEVRGMIWISMIIQVCDISQDGHWLLRIFWSVKDPRALSQQTFKLVSLTLKCNNVEQLTQWEASFNRLLQLEKQYSKDSRSDSLVRQHISVVPQRNAMEADEIPVMNYDEDEEEEEEEEEDDDQDGTSDDDYMRRRSGRSRSQTSRTADEYPRSSVSSQSTVGTPTSRHYNNMPGMTLPPLPPRSPTNLPKLRDPNVPSSHPDSNYSSSFSDAYPSSPPTSYPSSPKRSPTSAQTWRRPEEESEFMPRLMGGETVPTPTDEDRHIFPYTAPPPSVPKAFPPDRLQNTRARSYNSTPTHRHESSYDSALTPINSRTIYHSRSGVGEDKSQLAPLDSPAEIKVKIHHQDKIYMIRVPLEIEYTEIKARITRKIQLRDLDEDDGDIGLKYQDEDGDYITISSNEDVQMGFESRGNSSGVNFYLLRD